MEIEIGEYLEYIKESVQNISNNKSNFDVSKLKYTSDEFFVSDVLSFLASNELITEDSANVIYNRYLIERVG